MTTIAWDGKILAGDRLFSNGPVAIGESTKIFKRKKDGALCGCSMNVALGTKFMQWFLKGERGKPPSLRDGEEWARVVTIHPDGTITYHEPEGSFKLETNKFAIGSGMEFALGAMAMGAEADMAVRVASMYDTGTGSNIDTLELGK